MLDAEVRETLAGMEYGGNVDDAIEEILLRYVRNIKSVDKGWEWDGSVMWCETVDENRGEEVIVRVKGLMRRINTLQSAGQTEGKIKRLDVCKRLLHYGRQVAGREASVNRLRCAYALPIEFLEGGFEALNTHK